jgi:hypothetical protein
MRELGYVWGDKPYGKELKIVAEDIVADAIEEVVIPDAND